MRLNCKLLEMKSHVFSTQGRTRVVYSAHNNVVRMAKLPLRSKAAGLFAASTPTTEMAHAYLG